MNWMILEIFLFFLPVLLWGWWEQRSYKRYLAEKAERERQAPGAADAAPASPPGEAQ